MNTNTQKTMGAQLTIRLSKQIYAALQEIAHDKKVSLSEAARECLSDHFNRVQIDQQYAEIKRDTQKISQKLDGLIASFEVAAE